MDDRSLVADAPELESIANNSQRSKLSDALKAALNQNVIDELAPALRAALTDFPVIGTTSHVLRIMSSGRKPWVMRHCCADVLRIKDTLYRSGFSHYDRCITSGLRLVPDEPLLDALRQDYQAMLAAQMFYGETLTFGVIVDRLRQLEAEINQKALPA